MCKRLKPEVWRCASTKMKSHTVYNTYLAFTIHWRVEHLNKTSISVLKAYRTSGRIVRSTAGKKHFKLVLGIRLIIIDWRFCSDNESSSCIELEILYYAHLNFPQTLGNWLDLLFLYYYNHFYYILQSIFWGIIIITLFIKNFWSV